MGTYVFRAGLLRPSGFNGNTQRYLKWTQLESELFLFKVKTPDKPRTTTKKMRWRRRSGEELVCILFFFHLLYTQLYKYKHYVNCININTPLISKSPITRAHVSFHLTLTQRLCVVIIGCIDIQRKLLLIFHLVALPARVQQISDSASESGRHRRRVPSGLDNEWYKG